MELVKCGNNDFSRVPAMRFQFLDTLVPLKSEKSPAASVIIGMLFGGIGLGIYFWSIIDLVIPVVLVVVLILIIPGIGFFPGVVLVGIYGYMRAVNSNSRLMLEQSKQNDALIQKQILDVLPAAEQPADSTPDKDRRIRFPCPQCGRKFSVPESTAGKTRQCPGCGVRLEIPVAVS